MSSYPAQRIDEPPAVSLDPEVARVLRALLLSLADVQDATAATEAAHLPYWKPWPASVIGIRAAARVLREAADALPA